MSLRCAAALSPLTTHAAPRAGAQLPIPHEGRAAFIVKAYGSKAPAPKEQRFPGGDLPAVTVTIRGPTGRTLFDKIVGACAAGRARRGAARSVDERMCTRETCADADVPVCACACRCHAAHGRGVPGRGAGRVFTLLHQPSDMGCGSLRFLSSVFAFVCLRVLIPAASAPGGTAVELNYFAPYSEAVAPDAGAASATSEAAAGVEDVMVAENAVQRMRSELRVRPAARSCACILRATRAACRDVLFLCTAADVACACACAAATAHGPAVPEEAAGAQREVGGAV